MTILTRTKNDNGGYRIVAGEQSIGVARREGRVFAFNPNNDGRRAGLKSGLVFDRMRDSTAGTGLLTDLAAMIDGTYVEPQAETPTEAPAEQSVAEAA
jgi:hypothetical protein